MQVEDFESNDPIAWCPGCGNFSILKALKQAFVELDKQPSEIVIVSGIGQAPKTPHYLVYAWLISFIKQVCPLCGVK